MFTDASVTPAIFGLARQDIVLLNGNLPKKCRHFADFHGAIAEGPSGTADFRRGQGGNEPATL